MATLISEEEKTIKKNTNKRFKLPNLGGRVGLSISLGKYEIFVGIISSAVQLETVYRSKKIKAPKGGIVRILPFD